jgi:hypothetical protein
MLPLRLRFLSLPLSCFSAFSAVALLTHTTLLITPFDFLSTGHSNYENKIRR